MPNVDSTTRPHRYAPNREPEKAEAVLPLRDLEEVLADLSQHGCASCIQRTNELVAQIERMKRLSPGILNLRITI